MTRTLAIVLAVMLARPAVAMVGGAGAADPTGIGRQTVLIVGSNGSFCSGAVLAPQLLLTAVHCVPAGVTYKLVQFGNGEPKLKDIVTVARHPEFTARGMTTYRGTADVALMKLAEPLPANFRPTALGRDDVTIKVGDAFTVVGYGITKLGDPRSGGTARSATLVATGRPDSMDVRLMDPATRNTRAGLGACTGDSGGPMFAGDGAIVGVISWTTGPNSTRGCGGITGVTPLARYRGWIVETAKRLGAVLR